MVPTRTRKDLKHGPDDAAIGDDRQEVNIEETSQTITMEQDILKEIDALLCADYDPTAPNIADQTIGRANNCSDQSTINGATHRYPGAALRCHERTEASMTYGDIATASTSQTPDRYHAAGKTYAGATKGDGTDAASIFVEVELGLIFDILHFAVHVAQQYKPKLGHRRFHLRFDAAG
ncbi:hypothetical protein PUN28_008238 [Cardiocondyla obscurior]|uniref:Uncharacterized protein n=1 Tax=Cardiocondyla obscurior TaxID=286306 RepID=A0AAW2FWR5_9HYME